MCTVAVVSTCKKSTIDFPGETGAGILLLEQVMWRCLSNLQFSAAPVLGGCSDICRGTVVLGRVPLVEQSDETRALIHANRLQPLAPAVVQEAAYG